MNAGIFFGTLTELAGSQTVSGTAMNCTFTGNTSGAYGGGTQSANATHCAFNDNAANYGGGGVLNQNLTQIPAGKNRRQAESYCELRRFTQKEKTILNVRPKIGAASLLLGSLIAMQGGSANAQALVERTIAHTARSVSSLFLNDNGWVVWTTGLTPGSQVYLWNRSAVSALGLVNGNNRDARINNNNWVVWDGYRSTSNNTVDIYVWKNGGAYSDFGTGGNAAINDLNDVIWWATGTGANADIHDIYYRAHTAASNTNLTVFDSVGGADTPAINNSNQITWVRTVDNGNGGASNLVRATTANPSGYLQITGSADLNVYQALRGINNGGVLTWRQYNDAKLKWDVFKYVPTGAATGTITDLSDSLTASSYEPCVNDSGVIVWHADTGTGSALYWDQNTGMGPQKLLLSQPGAFNRPAAINNGGAIVYASGNGSGTGFDIILAEPSAAVSGTVTLPDVVNRRISVAFTFRPTNGDAPFSQTTTLDANGGFTLSNVPKQPYTLHIKGFNTLAQNVAIDTTSGSQTGAAATLLGGDANGDNTIDIGDFGVLVNAYDGDIAIPDSGYDAHADFNNDGKIDIGDFGILVSNYNAAGDM